MGPVYLFNLVSQHNKWLSVRQATIAGNIANVNTPGFKAVDAEPFEAVLGGTPFEMAITRPGHLRAPQPEVPITKVRDGEAWDVLHSGNSVVLEQELIKAGEANRSFALNAGVTKAFHRMLIASAKG